MKLELFIGFLVFVFFVFCESCYENVNTDSTMNMEDSNITGCGIWNKQGLYECRAMMIKGECNWFKQRKPDYSFLECKGNTVCKCENNKAVCK